MLVLALRCYSVAGVLCWWLLACSPDGTRGGSPLDQSLGTTVVLYVLQWWGPATGLCEPASADMVLWLPCGAASCWLHACVWLVGCWGLGGVTDLTGIGALL